MTRQIERLNPNTIDDKQTDLNTSLARVWGGKSPLSFSSNSSGAFQASVPLGPPVVDVYAVWSCFACDDEVCVFVCVCVCV